MIIVYFILASCAVFRLAEMIVTDKGPFHIFEKIRSIFPQDSQLDELVECFYCMGIWMAILISTYLACIHAISWRIMPLFVFSIAGGSVIIYRIIRLRK